MHKTFLHTALLALLLPLTTTISAQPRLTVLVVVDGMTQENLNTMRPYWSAGGLRLLSEEALQTTATFPHLVYGGIETMATLMTGTTPSHHGIMADQYFCRKERTPQPALQDPNTPGIGTHYTISPRTLPSTTITDEWRILHGERAKIYAIGLQPQTTILMAGHAANACCWLDHTTRKWVTTSFYTEGLPAAADEMNISGRIQTLAQQKWTPIMNISMYNYPTEQEQKHAFAYLNQDILLQSPAANKLVIELALAQQHQQQLGTDHIPDLLLLQLNTITPKAQTDAIRSAEQEDIYMDINQDLGFFIEQLNKRIGKNNYQLLLVGRPIKGHAISTFEKANIPVQQFNTDRTAALVSTYLMAIYGHERWVDGGYGPFIYLNRILIENKRMSLETIQRQVANFIMDFEGVQLAYPIHEAINSDDKHSIYRKHAGDVYFRLQDNWQMLSNDHTTFDNVIQTTPTAPVLFWSGNTISFPNKKIQATDIKAILINQ